LHDICVARNEGRQGELPQPKPRRLIPERSTTLLVLRDATGRVLLEQRPPAGIWGGMQSLPELPPERTADEFIADSLGLQLIAVSPAPTFVHVFSHFRLLITPLLCAVETASRAQEATAQWLAPEALASAALPAPIRKILGNLPP
jgi:A/G-specific adenine glycosylase